MFSTARERKKKKRGFPWNPNEEKERYTGSGAIGKIEAGCSAILQREGNGGQCVNSFSLFMSNSRGRRPSFFFDRATVLLSLLSLSLSSSLPETLLCQKIGQLPNFPSFLLHGTFSSSEIGILLSLQLLAADSTFSGVYVRIASTGYIFLYSRCYLSFYCLEILTFKLAIQLISRVTINVN